MNEFEKMGIDEDFNSYYKEYKISKPTLVQSKVIPFLLSKKSLICRAKTGTGKTLAYALPLAEKIKQAEDIQGITKIAASPSVVVIAPTKELAAQIFQVFKDISHHVKLRTRLIGSTSQKTSSLKNQYFEVLVSTPTKLDRALRSKIIDLSHLETLVFDEADQLFDMGFMKDIHGILRNVEYDQSNIAFFTATLSEKMQVYFEDKFKKLKMEKVFLEEDKAARSRIETFNIQTNLKEKNHLLKAFLEKTAVGRGIIFVNQKNQIEQVDEFLKDAMPKLKYKVLHGKLSATERESNLKSFINKKAQVLLASDVAARGIDIKDLEWVLNFNLPKTSIYYLHRVGRVGRAGKAGKVFNLITPLDSKYISLINKVIKEQSDINIDVIDAKLKKASSRPKTKIPKAKKKKIKQTKRTKLYNKA